MIRPRSGTPTPTTSTPRSLVMARHASPTLTPYRVPAYYLTEGTQGWPLILLADAASLGDAVAGSDDGLPVGVGLMPRDGALLDGPCPSCGTSCAVWMQVDDDGPGEVECLLCLCLTYGSAYGVVPSSVVEWVGWE